MTHARQSRPVSGTRGTYQTVKVRLFSLGSGGDQVGAVLDGVAEVRRRQRVVDQQRHLPFGDWGLRFGLRCRVWGVGTGGGVWGVGCGVVGVGCEVWVWGLGVRVFRFWVWNLRFGIWGLGFWVLSLWFWVWGLG